MINLNLRHRIWDAALRIVNGRSILFLIGIQILPLVMPLFLILICIVNLNSANRRLHVVAYFAIHEKTVWSFVLFIGLSGNGWILSSSTSEVSLLCFCNLKVHVFERSSFVNVDWIGALTGAASCIKGVTIDILRIEYASFSSCSRLLLIVEVDLGRQIQLQ